jgi:malto-oligosyltrehalose trehalohydrolase
MPFGAALQQDGQVRFRLWAPAQHRVGLAIDGAKEPLWMRPCQGGWHELITDRARAGSRYSYVLHDGLRMPDPASRFQPQDVHKPSEVIDPAAYRWSDRIWPGRPWSEAVIYELHVGTFTAEGTFRAAAEKLTYLRDLGITAIEIMPVADFPGRFNWGYDGVLLYAPDSSYGRPEDFKALVDAAHACGIMVLLDVVYNHFGPEGNYLRAYAPQFFTARHKTPWGDGINFDGADSGPVREFVIHNAIYWIEEFQLDGLRLDAVHAIRDDSPTHVARELAERVRAQVTTRPVHLLLENDENEPGWLQRNFAGEPVWFTAQWNDDVHHVLHTAATREGSGYYADYLGDTEKLGRALAEGFAFQGELMPYRNRTRGEASAHLPPAAFVAFAQNHDQIGNRAFGERLGQLASAEILRAVAAVYLLLPQVPMLFMGEEWNASAAFLFFCDFGGDLAEAVRQGRRREFARFPQFQDPAQWMRIPDPQSADTFRASKPDWGEIASPPHAAWLEWYRSILRVRRERIVPILSELAGEADKYEVLGEGAVMVRWRIADAELMLAANLSDTPKTGFPEPAADVLWQEGGPVAGAPWTVCWWLT